ncbi:Ferric enterobactin transport protein FepE [Grimontia celer]|uniref:Ferric enterobactin transport protein FepE n=1 Tax=Grimontia celer TaxID=1796497 RepID=A0A128F067_9GAMM|nr:Wzz/FepE/Etk N-terminal domain-containing protein [Grimontia celer]CZF80187.1 Ferric enterobactin transport protein FepE [Grimontia celer]
MTTTTQSESASSIGSQSARDDIDLRDLILALWRGKVIIAMFVMVSFLTSVIYAFNAQQWWSSKAIVTLPNVTSIISFASTAKQYQSAFDIYKVNGDVESGEEIDDLLELEKIYERFIRIFNSKENKLEFLRESSLVKKEFKTLGIDVDSEDVFDTKINSWGAGISAKALDKNDENSYTLSFQATSPEVSFDLLVKYINYTNEKVSSLLYRDLKSLLRIKRNELDKKLLAREEVARNTLSLEILKSQYAYEISKKSGIEKPIQILSNDEIFAIDLGAEVLSKKIVILKSVDDLTVIDPSLSVLENKIKTLDEPIEKTEEISSFNYLEKPIRPLNRDEPNRIRIALLSSILGLVLGIGTVLTRYSIKLASSREKCV